MVLSSGDGGIEAYDLATWKKWWFVRLGIDSGSKVEAKDGTKDNGLEHGAVTL